MLTIITSLLVTVGQILWKLGLQDFNKYLSQDNLSFKNVFIILRSGYILSGFIIYLTATGFFMYLLFKYEISMIIPLSSISFIFSLIAGVIIFNEDVNIYRWLGVIVIILGVYLIAKS